MSIRLGFRLGVSNDPNALPPTLKEVLDAVLAQAEPLMHQVLDEMQSSDKKTKVHRMSNLVHPRAAEAIEQLCSNRVDVGALFQRRLSDGFLHGGTKQAAHLRFDDLGMFGDEELSESVELARAQDEMSLAVEDVLPQLDAVMCTMLGWSTLQTGINPMRPEIYVRALRETLADAVPEAALREALIVPAAGYMGVRLRDMYREVSEWLRSFGIEPAPREGERIRMVGGTPVTARAASVAQTMLTLDKLRHLLAGKLDATVQAQRADGEFGHTVPASFEVLQQLKQVDTVVQKIERRSRAEPAKAAARAAAGETGPSIGVQATLGQQLGDEVVRLMFENLGQDARLLPAVTRRLTAMEPPLRALARDDSRFFSDRQHAARQLLDRITQRSLAFQDESDDGCTDFLLSIDQLLGKLGLRGANSEVFVELLAELDQNWARQDDLTRQHRAEAAHALLHVEQRNLLAQRLAEELEPNLLQREVQVSVRDFLCGPWSLVMAEARLRSADGGVDPQSYETLVNELLWSIAPSRTRQNPKRLAALVPGLLKKLREGLSSVDYPQALSSEFFNQLRVLHEAVLEQRRTEREAEALLPDSEMLAALSSEEGAGGEVWVGAREAGESGFIAGRKSSAMSAAATAGKLAADDPTVPLALTIGSWIELRIKDSWVRAQLNWASPHGTLFMFNSASGSAHSMSRRTMDRLRTEGGIRVVSGGHLLDDALDGVASTALKNSLKNR